MSKDLITIKPDSPLELALQIIEDTGHMGLPVVNDNGDLHGIITWSDVHDAAVNHERHLTVADYCATDLITVSPKDSLTHALDSLGYKEISHLPVVDDKNSKKIIGIITKGDLIKAYNRKRFIQKKMSWKGKEDE